MKTFNLYLKYSLQKEASENVVTRKKQSQYNSFFAKRNHFSWVFQALIPGVFALAVMSCNNPPPKTVPKTVDEKQDSSQLFWTSEEGAPTVPWVGGNPKNDSKELRFAVVGDNAGVSRPGIFGQAMNQINWLHPEFVINIGDLIEGFTDDKVAMNKEWDEIDATVSKLDMPFFFVPGNHDLSGNEALQVWQERKGMPYYAFTYKNVLFLCLDSEDPPINIPKNIWPEFHKVLDDFEHSKNEPEAQKATRAIMNEVAGSKPSTENGNFDGNEFVKARFSDAQVEFVRKTLDEHKDARWTFVFMHKPGWTPNPNDGKFDKIEKMLANRPYTIIAGHTHYYAYEKRNGRDYITMATTGGLAQDGDIKGRLDHVAWITVPEKGDPKVANIKLNGILDKNAQSGQTDVYK